MLAEHLYYGPPGFGETPSEDVRDHVFVLILARPVRVEPLDDAAAKKSTSLNSIEHVREIQLFLRKSQIAEAQKLIKKSVVVVGTLSEAVAPRQYTDVTMDVQAIRPQ